jgi:hypothetical protein
MPFILNSAFFILLQRSKPFLQKNEEGGIKNEEDAEASSALDLSTARRTLPPHIISARADQH